MASNPLAPAEMNGDALLRVAAAAAGAHELEDVLQPAAEEARRAIDAASLSVSRWERDQGILRVLVNVGELGTGEEPRPGDETYPVRLDRKAERLLLEGRVYFCAIDDTALDELSAQRLRRLGKESEVGVPILVDGKAWGEVYATTAPGQPRLRGEDVRFLEAVAGQLALVIGRAERFARVSRLAYEDSLTGLANRRALEEQLARSCERKVPLTVVLCDVDELKTINDERGHEAGDLALRRVANALVAAAASRPGSLVGRLAGDEFCVVMEGAGLDEARAVAARTLDLLGAGGEPIMVSCGAAVAEQGTSTPADLLKAADAALYRAKLNGGGQLFTAGKRAGDLGQWSDRRALRRSTPDRIRAAVRDVYVDLGGHLDEFGPLERIEAVSMALAGALNAAAWAVSFAPAGSGFLRTMSVADDRDQRLEGLRLEVENDVYPLCEFPATTRLVEAGAGALAVHRDDVSADSAERALLVTYEREGVLMAAAADHDGTWLLEIYADDATAMIDEAVVEAGLLMRAAMPPRPAGRDRARLLERRTAQLRVAGELGRRLVTAGSELAVVRATVAELQRGLEADAVCVVRLDDGQATLVAGTGLLGDRESVGFAAPTGRGLIGRCLRERRAVIARDIRDEPDYFSTPTTGGILSELDVPVEGPDGLWGAISIQALRTDAFDDEDVRLVEIVAVQLGAALTHLH